MQIQKILRVFPIAGHDFAEWFCEKYRISIDVFDLAPDRDCIMVINMFLGYEEWIPENANLVHEGKRMFLRLRKYEKVLNDFDKILSFDEIFRNMSQEEIYAEFSANKRERFRITIKDALRRIREDKQDEPLPKSQNAPIREKIDTFWDDAKKHTSSDSPF